MTRRKTEHKDKGERREDYKNKGREGRGSRVWKRRTGRAEDKRKREGGGSRGLVEVETMEGKNRRE